jgi:hypothetical protein
MSHEPRKPSIGKILSAQALPEMDRVRPRVAYALNSITALSSLRSIAFGQCPSIETAAFGVPFSIICCIPNRSLLTWAPAGLHPVSPLAERGRSNLCGLAPAERHKRRAIRRLPDEPVESH